MKHKCITILGVLSVIFLLCSCTNGGNDKTTSDKPVEASENNQEKNSDKGKKLSAFEKLLKMHLSGCRTKMDCMGLSMHPESM